MKIMNRTLAAVTICAMTAISVAGCNTFKGAGKDIQRGGEAVENAAENAHSKNSNYKTPRHSIESSSASGGSINPEGKATFATGASSTYTVRANAGYHIADVVVDGKSMGAMQRHTFEKLSQNHTISAKFTPDSTR